VSKMEENNKTFEQQPEPEGEYGGIMEMSNGTQVAIATGFVGLPAFEAVLQLLHFGGFTGLAVGALGAGAVALAGKTIVDRQTANGSLPKLPIVQQFRSANWGALLSTGIVDENAEAKQEGSDTIPPAEPQKRDEHPKQGVFPRYPIDETLPLGRVTTSGQRFDPHMDHLNGEGLVVAGTQGAGKSNVAALVGESAGRCNMPTVIFDLKREYHTLVDVVPNGLRAGHISHQHEVGPGYFVLTEDNAHEFVHEVMTNGYQAIVDLPSYGDSLEESARVIAAVVNGLMNWSQAQKPEDRIPCLVMLDEAHWFLPQRQELSPTIHKETLQALQSAFFRIVNTGRSYGFTMCFFTQSIANLQKWAIKNCKRKIIMKHVEKNDLDRCEEEVEESVATRAEIANLEPGVGIVIGFTKEPVMVQFDRRQSRHDSHTPKIERVKRFRHVRRQTRPEPLSAYRNRFAGTVPVTPEPLVHSRERTTEPTLAVAPVVAKTPVEDELERALAAWNAGHTSVTKLQDALQVKHNKAWNLYKQLKEKRLIAV